MAGAAARCGCSGSMSDGRTRSTIARCTSRSAEPPVPSIHHVHRKMFLPTYGLFDEERFVEPGHEVRAFDTPWGRAALLVCEDAWHSLTGTIAALDGAQIIFLSAARPARGIWPREDGIPGPGHCRAMGALDPGHRRRARRLRVVRQPGRKRGRQGFPGQFDARRTPGDVRLRGPLFEEALLPVTIDLTDLTRVRADCRCWRTSAPGCPTCTAHCDRLDIGERCDPSTPMSPAAPRPVRRCTAGAARRRPAAAGDRRGRSSSNGWSQFIRDEFARRGFTRAVVGLSGGVDSAVTAYLARARSGPENVVGVRMPYRTSSPDSLRMRNSSSTRWASQRAPSTSRRLLMAISRRNRTPIPHAAATSWPACA